MLFSCNLQLVGLLLGFIYADQVPSQRNEEDEVIGEWAKDYEHLSLGIQTWSVSSPILVLPRVLRQRLCFVLLDRMLSGRSMSPAQNGTPVMRIWRL